MVKALNQNPRARSSTQHWFKKKDIVKSKKKESSESRGRILQPIKPKLAPDNQVVVYSQTQDLIATFKK